MISCGKDEASENCLFSEALAYPGGFEPLAFGVGVQRSIQLSYGYIRGAGETPTARVIIAQAQP